MKRIKLKKIIVIGGSGFVGKSLKDYCKRKSFKVLSYSRGEKKNFIKIKKLPYCDYIFYCLKSKKISDSLKLFNHFKLLIKENLKSTKILFFSSGAVYGKANKGKKFKESDKINISNINSLGGYKKKYAKLLGLKFINIKQAKDFNVIINTTSNYKILEKSMSLLEDEGKIVEASWYGSKKGFLSLGDCFHSKRLKLISSQVSQIPKHMKNKYDYKKRLKLAINSLEDKKLEKLITSESNFFNLERDYFKILNNKNVIMHLIKY